MARRTPTTSSPDPDGAPVLLDVAGLERLIALLAEEGYTVLGPTVRDGAVVYDEVRRVADLPVGWTEEQAPGRYRLKRRDDEAVFGFTVGPHAWKRALFPPRRRLWRAERSEGDGGFTIAEEPVEAPKQAFLGVRACELAAIAVQDRVFMGGPYVDPVYAARRENTFLVAVNCTQAAATCFCASMDTGPQARAGFDLALTELLDDDRHVFLLEAGTEAGRTLAARLPTAPAAPEDVDAARSGASPGTIHRFDAAKEPMPARFFHYSTHAFSVAEAVELARVLGALPPRLFVFGIEGRTFEAGAALSPEVARAAEEAAEEIARLLAAEHPPAR